MTKVSSGLERRPAPVSHRRRTIARLARGRAGDPPWARPALALLLAATAVLYVWGLGASGWANSFYSAAVQAGTRSWPAFFFGSSDAANFITVDKTPMALWPMELSARIFGVGSWSILVPQALMGVATVGVLYATVRRSLGGRGDAVAAGGGLLAGALLATTPVAALMFRFNNPDALLTLLLTLGAYALLRARERASTRWLLLAGACVGLAFLAKMLQAFLVVPAFALVYLVTAAPRRDSGALASGAGRAPVRRPAPDGSADRTGRAAARPGPMDSAAGPPAAGCASSHAGTAAPQAGKAPPGAGTPPEAPMPWADTAAGPTARPAVAARVVLAAQLGGAGRAALAAWRAPGGRGTAGRGVLGRLWQLALAAVVMVAAAGWWVVAVMLVPAGSRPYIGGSQHDSVLELAFGYNGLGRLSGDETGGLGNTNQDAGWGRLFGSGLGGQIGWLLPAALVLLAAGLYVTRRRRAGTGPDARDAAAWAGFALWGGWLLVTGAVFSFMQGIFHPYYTVALAPAVAAIVGMGAAVLWRRRGPAALGTLAATAALTAWWSFTLLGRSPGFQPWLRPSVLAAGLVAAAALAAAAFHAGPAATGGRRWAVLAGTGAAVAVAVTLAGPAAYAVDTAASPQHGAIPSAGPATAGPGGMRGFGGRFRGGFAGGAFRGGGTGGAFPGGNGGGFPGGPGGSAGQGGTAGTGRTGGTAGTGGTGGTGGGGGTGIGGAPFAGGGLAGPAGGRGGSGGAGRPGGFGGLLDAPVPGAALTRLLRPGAGSFTWVAATVGSNNAAGYQLATGDPVMAIGGFNGTDPAPALARFQAYVRAHRVHYFIDRSVMGGMGRQGTSGSDDAERIAAWVRRNFTATTVDGTTVYDLAPGG